MTSFCRTDSVVDMTLFPHWKYGYFKWYFSFVCFRQDILPKPCFCVAYFSLVLYFLTLYSQSLMADKWSEFQLPRTLTIMSKVSRFFCFILDDFLICVSSCPFKLIRKFNLCEFPLMLGQYPFCACTMTLLWIELIRR